MKKIHGIEIQESKDLGFNLKLLRKSLKHKLSFWTRYDKGVQKIAETMGTRRVNFLVRILYFVILLPNYVMHVFSGGRITRLINAAEDELIEHYTLPETKVRQFRLECAGEKEFYQTEIAAIRSEILSLNERRTQADIGEKFRNEIHDLVGQYQSSLESKLLKFNFYQSCEERLAKIEDQILLQRTLHDSKQKLIALQDDESDSSRLTEIKKEFELYDYYGDLLEDISLNLKKVSADRTEKLRESELNEMLSRIKLTAEHS